MTFKNFMPSWTLLTLEFWVQLQVQYMCNYSEFIPTYKKSEQIYITFIYFLLLCKNFAESLRNPLLLLVNPTVPMMSKSLVTKELSIWTLKHRVSSCVEHKQSLTSIYQQKQKLWFLLNPLLYKYGIFLQLVSFHFENCNFSSNKLFLSY